MLLFFGGHWFGLFWQIGCFYNCSDGFSRHLTHVADSFCLGGAVAIDSSIFFRDLLYSIYSSPSGFKSMKNSSNRFLMLHEGEDKPAEHTLMYS